MESGINLYKNFIDDLVKIRDSALTKWVRSKGFPDTESNKKINHFLGTLCDEDKDILCQIIQNARDGGIHDTLAYLNDEISLNGLKIIKNNIEFPVEPFDTELYYDWVCRREGDKWPDEQ